MCKDSNFAQILKKKWLKSNRIKIKWVETPDFVTFFKKEKC